MTKYQLPNTNYQKPTTKYQLPNTKYQIPVTSYQLRVISYQLSTTPPNSLYQLLIAICCSSSTRSSPKSPAPDPRPCLPAPSSIQTFRQSRRSNEWPQRSAEIPAPSASSGRFRCNASRRPR